MTPLVPITLFGWIPVVLLLFAALPGRRAVLTAFVFSWLFLPIAGYAIEGLPDYTKVTATCVGAIFGSVLFDARRWHGLRPCFLDLVIALWCLSPLASSLSNGLGAYDGLSGTMLQMVTWGIPYLLGRVYFSDLQGLRELAVAIFIGGLVYVPLCLWEWRMAPSLHKLLYGFHQHQFVQTKRAIGFRPMVFMQHGLMVGIWMASASLAGIWLALAGRMKSVGPLPMMPLVAVLIATTMLCQSFGAIGLLALATACLWIAVRARTALPLLILACLPLTYMATRTAGAWSGEELVQISEALGGTQRAGSLRFRLDNETRLIERAMERPLLGWGGWNRNRVLDESGRDTTVADGMWVITLGQRGLLGLCALSALLAAPLWILLRRIPIGSWRHPAAAGAAALAVMLIMYLADSLFNAMTNPVYMLAAGGLGAVSPRVAALARESAVTRTPEPIHSAATISSRPERPHTGFHSYGVNRA